jgi:hypothetical protein
LRFPSENVKKLRVLKFAAFLFSALIFASGSLVSSASANSGSTPASASSWAIDEALAKHLYLDKEWLRLGHYRTHGRGFYSEATNPLFFIDPNGRSDPRAELIATLRDGFSATVRPPAMKDAPAMTVRCQFPARWKWLSQELHINLPPIECKDYDSFRKKVNPASLTLVFSGYYTNNPSSLFGHLLFRLNNKDRFLRGGGSELLDYGSNFGANPTTQSPLLYTIYGMTGTFHGNFAMLPYFYKVREYSDSESRDLWEYELNLSPDELDRLADHLWELNSTYFDYYYFTQNCAYQLLAVLDVAAPRLNLIDKTRFLVIPSDALKIVTKEPGLLKRVHYRASPLRQLHARYKKLTSEEKSEFLRVANTEKPVDELPSNLTQESRADVLDTVLDYIDYRYMRELVFEKDPVLGARKQRILAARAQLPVGEALQVTVDEKERPDLSHPSFRYGIGGGGYADSSGRTSLIDAEMRFAFHSLYDPLDGFLANSSLESWRIRARVYPERKRIELQEFALLDVRSFSPLNKLTHPMSFQVYAGVDRVHDRRCDNCLTSKISFTGGVAVAPSSDNSSDSTLLYALIGPVAEMSPNFSDNKLLASLSARAGMRLKFSSSFQLNGEAEWRRVFDRETFDRLAAIERARFDFGQPSEEPWAFEAEFSQEANTQSLIGRYLKFF